MLQPPSQASCALTYHSRISNIGDPVRPAPPATPFPLFDAEEPGDKSLLLTSYSGNPISAWNLESCLTEGFKTVADVLYADTPTHPTALDSRKWLCYENGIEVVVAGNGHGLDALSYYDLASILTLISKFHEQYAMRSIEFDILGPGGKGTIGQGWVDLTGLGERAGNGTT